MTAFNTTETMKMQKKMKTLLTAVALMCATACSDGFTYTTYPCYLVIDNSIHQNTTLAAAMTAASPGVFCTIRSNETKKKYLFSNNMGQTSETPFTAIDLRQTRSIGMNNAVVVGFGSLTGEFYAYDLECPECYDPNAVPNRSKPLDIHSDGNATCKVCHRTFNLNSGGNCTSDAGVKNMTRYRAATAGPFGTLAVGN